jgi:hypothetical protein
MKVRRSLIKPLEVMEGEEVRAEDLLHEGGDMVRPAARWIWLTSVARCGDLKRGWCGWRVGPYLSWTVVACVFEPARAR